MSSSRHSSKGRLRLAVAVLLATAGPGTPVWAAAASGHWQLVKTEGTEASTGKPCTVGLEYIDQGVKGKVLAAGPNSLTLGTYVHWVKDPFWTKVEFSWQPFPARLDPLQKIQWSQAVAWVVDDPRPAPAASAFVYRKSGVGGGQDELGRVTVPTRGGKREAATKMHETPKGPPPKGAQLVYFHGGRDATGGCDFTATYDWVADRSPASAPASGIKREPGIDRPGSDYRREDGVPSADACARLCEEDRRCLAFTWVRPGVMGPLPICVLKNPAPAPTKSDCCDSGVRR